MEKYLTPKQVAEIFGVKTRTVWDWIRKKKLGAIKSGRLYHITPEHLKEFQEARKTK